MDYDRAYTEYQLSRKSFPRRLFRNYYLETAANLITGKTIDFGCGVGELLKYLPDGSLGLEVNRASVKYCQDLDLNVEYYDPIEDNYLLRDFIPGEFDSLIICHVLEHLQNPEVVLNLLLESAERLGIQKVVVIVPGRKGFKSDDTHITFIDQSFFSRNNLEKTNSFIITSQYLFPINSPFFENFLTHLELRIVYNRL